MQFQLLLLNLHYARMQISIISNYIISQNITKKIRNNLDFIQAEFKSVEL